MYCIIVVIKTKVMIHSLNKENRARKINLLACTNLNNLYKFIHSDSLLIGILFMSRIDKFFNFIYSLLDSI